MAAPLAEAFVRISLDMKYLQAQQAQAQKMLDAFANQKVSRSMTPKEVFGEAMSKAVSEAMAGIADLNDGLKLAAQLEGTAAAQAHAMAEGIREANAAADPLVSKMRNLEQLKTLMRGGFLSGEDAAVAARRMNGPTAGEADEKRLMSIAKQAYDSTRTAAERYQQAVENLNAARSQMGEDTYRRAMEAERQKLDEVTGAAQRANQALAEQLRLRHESPVQEYHRQAGEIKGLVASGHLGKDEAAGMLANLDYAKQKTNDLAAGMAQVAREAAHVKQETQAIADRFRQQGASPAQRYYEQLDQVKGLVKGGHLGKDEAAAYLATLGYVQQKTQAVAAGMQEIADATARAKREEEQHAAAAQRAAQAIDESRRAAADRMRSQIATPKEVFAQKSGEVMGLVNSGHLSPQEGAQAIARLRGEYERAVQAMNPFAATQQRINMLIEQGTPANVRFAREAKQLSSEMQQLGYSAGQQKTALDGLEKALGNGSTSGRRFNAMLQQASFGAQDFITVMAGGGGLQMALMSAANNAAQVAAISGGMGGALAGTAVTIAAVVIPAIGHLVNWYVRWGLATEEVRKQQEQLNEFLERRHKSAEEVARDAGDPARQRQKVEDLESAKEAETELKRQRRESEGRGASKEALEKQLRDEQSGLNLAQNERKKLGKKSTFWSEVGRAFTEFGSSESAPMEVTGEQNEMREKVDKEIHARRERMERIRRKLDDVYREEESAQSTGPSLMDKAIELQEQELDKGNKKYRQRKAKEEKTARAAFARENASIAGDMNEYESRRFAVQEKFDSRRERLEENRHISEQERNRSLKLAEQARDQDLEKLKRDETHHKNRAIREADRLDSEARNISNPVAAAKARIEAEYREKRERLDENKFISEEKRKQIKANLDKAEAYEKSRAGFSPQMVGLQALHSEIQKSLYKSAGDKAAESTAQNTGKIAGDAKRSADALEKMAAAGNSGSAHYAE